MIEHSKRGKDTVQERVTTRWWYNNNNEGGGGGKEEFALGIVYLMRYFPSSSIIFLFVFTSQGDGAYRNIIVQVGWLLCPAAPESLLLAT